MEPWLHNGTKGIKVTTLSIKDVPESWAEALRQRAARNHRSLQGELKALVEHAITHDDFGTPSHVAGTVRNKASIVGYDNQGWPIVRQGTLTAEEVFARMREAGAKTVPGQPLAVDILRRDRDSR